MKKKKEKFKEFGQEGKSGRPRNWHLGNKSLLESLIKSNYSRQCTHTDTLGVNKL